jgi:hypothetical protein
MNPVSSRLLRVGERGRLAGDVHVAGHGGAEVVLAVPAEVFLVRVQPEQQLLLGRLGDLAVRCLVARIRLEVVGDVVGQVGQQGGSEEDADVQRYGHPAWPPAARASRIACLMTPRSAPSVWLNWVYHCYFVRFVRIAC